MSEVTGTPRMRIDEEFVDWRPLIIASANCRRDPAQQSEDFALLDCPSDGPKSLIGVFDSVGDRDQGLLVSHRAGKAIQSWYARRGGLLHADVTAEETEADLCCSLLHADQTVAAIPLPEQQKRPATAAVLGVMTRIHSCVKLSLAHIGDARAYLLRQGESLQRLTEDQGYFSFLQRKNLLTKEECLRIEQAESLDDLSLREIEHFDRRNLITCAVGWSDFPSITTISLSLQEKDTIVFCTDGIHDNLTDHEIASLLTAADAAKIASQLVQAASQRSHQHHLRAKPDDLTALVVHYVGEDQRCASIQAGNAL